MANFRHQPAPFPGVDFFVGPEHVQRRTGVIGLAIQFHADVAAVVLDDLRDQGGRTDMKAAIARNRRLDRADFGVMLEHGVAQAATEVQVKPRVSDGVVHQHRPAGCRRR